MIAIIDYGMGNLRSAEKALIKIGQDPIITSDKEIIESASHVILPGVGAFRDAIANLQEHDLVDTIHKVIDKGTPFLGICIGLQLMMEKSFENGEYEGLGIFKGYVKKFDEKYDIKIPQIGWNRVSCNSDKLFSGLDIDPYFYFVHSYHPWEAEYSQSIGIVKYGYMFPAVLKNGNAYGVQFHPEKSGENGMKLLNNFCEM